MPPLYYELLHIWLSFVGMTPFGLRMLSVMFSMLAVALVYLIGRRAIDQTAGCVGRDIYRSQPVQIITRRSCVCTACLPLRAFCICTG